MKHMPLKKARKVLENLEQKDSDIAFICFVLKDVRKWWENISPFQKEKEEEWVTALGKWAYEEGYISGIFPNVFQMADPSVSVRVAKIKMMRHYVSYLEEMYGE